MESDLFVLSALVNKLKGMTESVFSFKCKSYMRLLGSHFLGHLLTAAGDGKRLLFYPRNSPVSVWLHEHVGQGPQLVYKNYFAVAIEESKTAFKRWNVFRPH